MYRRTYLPTQPLAELAVGDIEKVTWVAFGSTVHSWFFTYAFKNGATTFRLGKGVPGPLREYVDRFGKQADLEGTLRVQLGHANSFVVWSRTAWACSDNIPDELRKRLCTISSGTRGGQNITMGSLKKGTLINVQWNMDDSYYLETTYAHGRRFRSAMLVEAWRSLWPGLEACIFGQEHLAEIAVSEHFANKGYLLIQPSIWPSMATHRRASNSPYSRRESPEMGCHSSCTWVRSLSMRGCRMPATAFVPSHGRRLLHPSSGLSVPSQVVLMELPEIPGSYHSRRAK